jgi:hypothetical protein
MLGKLERADHILQSPRAPAAIVVKEVIKGNRSTKRHATRGRSGTAKITLWREIIDMIEDKGLAVSAALFLLAASEILGRFESQE